MVFACVNSASQVAEDPVWPARSQAGRSHRPFRVSLGTALFCFFKRPRAAQAASHRRRCREAGAAPYEMSI